VLRKNSGFLLLELIIYLFLSVGLCYLTFSLLHRFQESFLRQTSLRNTLMKRMLVLDLIKRDVISAGMRHADWDSQNNLFIKRYLTQDGIPKNSWISWRVVPSGLKRQERALNTTVSEDKSQTMFFPCDLKQLTFVPQFVENESLIEGIKLQYAFKKSLKKIIHENIRLRNRVIG